MKIKKNSSIRKRLFILLFSIILPLTIVLVGNFIYSIHQVRTNVIETNETVLEFYREQIDAQLNNISNYLLSLTNSSDIPQDLQNTDEDLRILAAISLANHWADDLSLYPTDYYFIYLPRYDEFIHQYNSNFINHTQAEQLKQFFSLNKQLLESSRLWTFTPINGKDCLLFIYRTSDYCLGSVISADSLLSSLEVMGEHNQAEFFLTDKTGQTQQYQTFIQEEHIQLTSEEAYSFTGKSQKYIQLSQTSKISDYILWELIPDTNALGLLDHTQLFLFGVALFLFCSIPVVIYMIFKWIIVPLRRLGQAIIAIKKGDMDYQIRPVRSAKEFEDLNTAFNDMSNEIKHLKIQVYEETIQKQQAELNFLHMQIRPHFFLNALTTISNYMHLGDVEKQQKFLLYLGNYVRYNFSQSVSLVTIHEEIFNVENYIAMENLQYNDSILFIPTVTSQGDHLCIPPFSILTFIENSIKHGLNREKHLTILMDVKVIDSGKIQIQIEDDGVPFNKEYLEQFHSQDFMRQKGNTHVGIRNIRKTMDLIYHGNCTMELSNSDLGGARVLMILPAQTEMKF